MYKVENINLVLRSASTEDLICSQICGCSLQQIHNEKAFTMGDRALVMVHVKAEILIRGA